MSTTCPTGYTAACGITADLCVNFGVDALAGSGDIWHEKDYLDLDIAAGSPEDSGDAGPDPGAGGAGTVFRVFCSGYPGRH